VKATSSGVGAAPCCYACYVMCQVSCYASCCDFITF